MAKAILSTTVDFEIAKKIEEDAYKNRTSISEILRNIINEKYGNKI